MFVFFTIKIYDYPKKLKKISKKQERKILDCSFSLTFVKIMLKIHMSNFWELQIIQQKLVFFLEFLRRLIIIFFQIQIIFITLNKLTNRQH